MNIKEFVNLLNQSKRYSMEGSILTIENYRTGEKVKLDLSVLEEYEEAFEEMQNIEKE